MRPAPSAIAVNSVSRAGFTRLGGGNTRLNSLAACVGVHDGIMGRTGGLIPARDLAVPNGFAASSEPPAGRRSKIVIAGE